MTRKKVKLTWIVNDSARKASLKKRRVGLQKKVSELTILCGVNAFVLIYSPEEREPQMWPSRPVVEQLLARFNNMPEMEKCKKMMNQETYLKERIGKVQEQLKKLDQKNKEMDASQVMEKLHERKTIDDFNENELQGLIWFSQEKKKEMRKRIEYYQQVNPLPPKSLPPPHSPLPPPPPPQLSVPVDSTAGVKGSTGGGGRNPPDSGLPDQWFIDMMNNNQNTAGSNSAKAKSDAGLISHQTLVACSDAANQMGVYNIGSAMGIPQGNININIRSSSLRGGNDFGNDGKIGLVVTSYGIPTSLPEMLPPKSSYDSPMQWPGNFQP